MGLSLELTSLLYPDVAVRARRVYEDMNRTHGRVMRCTRSLATFDEQQALYNQGRTAPGKIVTWAVPGFSWHNFGLAFDTCFKGMTPYPPDEDPIWDVFGNTVKAHGLLWGGDFPPGKIDRPHADLTYGLSLSEVQALYQAGGLKAVWAKCDQIRGIREGSEWEHKLLAETEKSP